MAYGGGGMGGAAETFGSLQKMLHFCIASRVKGNQKIDHVYEASVGERISKLQCVFRTHFGLWGSPCR
jgi:hypothetical protein